MIKNSLCVLGLSLALGCATAVVRPYVGEQQAWPTSNGSIANVRYDLPVFTSLPPAAYEVVAELRINSPLYAQPVEGHLSTLVKKGLELGADALVFVEGQVFFSTTFGVSAAAASAPASKRPTVSQVNRFNPDSFRPGVSIIAIRWLDEPPLGLPARYARYAAKMLPPETPAEPITPAPAPAPEPAKPEAVVPPTPEPPKAEAPAAVAPAAPATPEPVPAPAEAPKTDVTPAAPTPRTNFAPKNEAAPAVPAPTLDLQSTTPAAEPAK